MGSRAVGALLSAASLLVASTTQAQSFVRADCQGVVGVSPNRYDTPVHERWYKRYWTGTCDQLPRCIPGSPSWNDMVGKLVARGAPAERATVLAKSCRLGQLIGLEWSRSKAIRKIDLNDLRDLNKMLEAPGDVVRNLDKVEQAARAKLAGR